MRRRTDRFIDMRDAAYLELLIGDKDPESKKIGLQRLCKFYRYGLRYRDSERLTTHLMGLLFDEAPKVKRWALNALALAGTKKNVVAIVEAIQRNRNDPDILGAGISALCALLPEEEARSELVKADLPIEGTVLLAAVQHSGHFQDELRVTRVNIDNAGPAELRRAGILVGLDRAPENLFSLSQQNEQVIGELNSHPDHIVAQYSIWATYESPKLSLKNLRLRLHDVASKPTNIRKYVYQLIVKDIATAQDNLDFLVMGSEDESADARAGLATGLSDIYFDSLETVVLDWYDDEDADFVRQRLLEHMARNADRCPSYQAPVLRAYEASDANSLVRARLESAARDTQIYLAMKKVAYNAEGRDLFGLTALSNSKSKISAPSARAQSAKILLVTALPKEEAAVRATFDHDDVLGQHGDNTVYRIGSYGVGNNTRDVVLASAGVGKSNAATVTANALRTFPHLEYIIMVGIAGGCPNIDKPDEHVRLGDVVFSGNSGIIEYDHVKETDTGRQVRGSLQRPSAALLQVANDLIASDLMSVRPWETIISATVIRLGERFDRPSPESDTVHSQEIRVAHPDDPDRRPNVPRIHAGAIGTADTLLKNDLKRDDLRNRYGVRAVEMEASGLQNAAWAHGKDIFVIRGICDYCDQYKNDIWQNYAAVAAAGYARAVVEAMPSEWF
jgi:nucleoside phosphorylase